MSLGTMSIDGLISGLDTTSIIRQLTEIEQAPLLRLQTQKAVKLSQQTAFGVVNAQLLALRTTATTLSSARGLTPRSASSSNEDLVMVSAGNTADQGTYDVVVSKLAQAHKVSSQTFTSKSEATGASGDIVVNGVTIRVGSDDSLLTIRNRINEANAGVNATILSVTDTDHRLLLTAESTGADSALNLIDANETDVLEQLGLVSSSTSIKHAITDGAAGDLFTNGTQTVGSLLSLDAAPAATVQINGTDVAIDLATHSLQDIATAITTTVSGVTATAELVEQDGENLYRLQIVGDSGTPTLTDADNVLVTLGVLKKAYASELETAQDAEFTIDGISFTRSTNTITDALEGVALSLLAADESETVVVQVTADTGAAKQLVQDFVNAYNKVMSTLDQHLDYDTETKQSGVLSGHYAVLNLQHGLRRALSDAILAPSGAPTVLSHIGITVGSDGQLDIDDAELMEALNSPSDVARLFGLNATTTDADVQFHQAGTLTQPSPEDGYAVNITAVATQATVLGNDLSGDLAQAETLTFNGSAIVSLSAGTTLTEAVAQINAAFSTHRIEAQAVAESGRIRITNDPYGSSQTIDISSTVGSGVAGSTGLGAATAGETATYAGTDVEGTINGEAATGRGQYLTGDSGNDNTDGLILRITATTTGDQGAVHLSKGAASRLQDYVDRVTDPAGGLVSNAQEGLEARIESLDDQMDRVEAHVLQATARLQREFAALEQTLSRLQSQSDAMLQQLQGLLLGQAQYG